MQSTRFATRFPREVGVFFLIRVHLRASAVLFFFFGCGFAAPGFSVSFVTMIQLLLNYLLITFLRDSSTQKPSKTKD